MNLDGTDLALVRSLQDDGRLPYEVLAARTGLSRTAVRTRVQRLLDSGAVVVVAVVHPAVLGLPVSAHVSVAVDGAAGPVAHALAELPDAPFVTLTAGAFPVITELRTADFDTLSATVAKISTLPKVRSVRTALYTQVLKDPYLPSVTPDSETAERLDETDRILLARLQRAGRSSFVELARHAGLSPAAARVRVLRLLSSGVIRVTALVRAGTLGPGRLVGFELRMTEADTTPSPETDDYEARAAHSAPPVLRQAAAWDEMQYLATCVGPADALGTLSVSDTAEALPVLERLRALPGVHDVRSWVHADVVKERYEGHLPR